jgi:hypothetical protein
LRQDVHHYRIAGLYVGSEVVLPGLNAATPGSGTPDVTIRGSSVPASLQNATASGPTWQIAGRQFLLRVPSVARFLLTAGNEIAFEVEPGADASDIPIFILSSAFGILLHQREQIVLHASAVRVNGKAILFCGPSGAGKSTLAAALSQRGYGVITDDFCAITVNGTAAPMVHPDGRRLKLWAQAIEQLDLANNRGERVRSTLEKFYVDAGETHVDPLPLGAVYALREARPPIAPGIERPNVANATVLLQRNAYRPRLIARMDQRVLYFHAAAAIANNAGIFRLARKLDYAAMPELVSSLERHWRDIGLMEQAA